MLFGYPLHTPPFDLQLSDFWLTELMQKVFDGYT